MKKIIKKEIIFLYTTHELDYHDIFFQHSFMIYIIFYFYHTKWTRKLALEVVLVLCLSLLVPKEGLVAVNSLEIRKTMIRCFIPPEHTSLSQVQR